MGPIKNSSSLEKLLTYAANIKDGSAAVTAEKFIVSVIDAVSENSGVLVPEDEFANLLLLLRIYLPVTKMGMPSLRDSFISHIMANEEENDGYMHDCMNRARRFAEAQGKAELSPSAVLSCILHNPNEFLQSLASAAVDAPPSREGFGGVPDGNPIRPEGISGKRPSAPEGDDIRIQAEESAPESAVSDMPKDELLHITKRTKKLIQDLKAVVFGQDNAISVIASGYFQGEILAITDEERVRPRATFLLAGPPGVGKTLLARTVAASLGWRFRSFDMSEYSDKEANVDLIGTDKTYKDSRPGSLTSFVAANPKCVLLFDEIEKAHINTLHLFLQILDSGKLGDKHTDQESFFKDAIIIVTTNAGRQLYEGAEGGDFSGYSRKVILNALGADVNPQTGDPFFPAALCSRFAAGNVVMLNRISAHHLYDIARKEVLRNAENFSKEIGIPIRVDDPVYTALLFSEGGSTDARAVTGRAVSFLSSELFELFRLVSSEGSDVKIRDLKGIRITVKLPENDPEITNLFTVVEDHRRVLVFGDPSLADRCAEACPDTAFVSAATAAEAENIMQQEEIAFVLADPLFGRTDDADYLNAEDLPSAARDFLQGMRKEHAETPVYLLCDPAARFSPEQEFSFLRQGVRNVIYFNDNTEFAAKLREVGLVLHQQASMRELARTNRLVQFETAQCITEDKTAQILLFDFRLSTAVTAEDAKNILSSISLPDETFDDVIGAEDAKKELDYFVKYLKNPKKYAAMGVKASKGVLLYGPPGTGKTMLARAMAKESGVTYICADGGEFLKKYAGEGPDRVRELFLIARKYSPAILFIDEIDSIAKLRGGNESTGGGAHEVLTTFLTEMDGFKNDPSSPVFVLAATNYDVEERIPGRGLDPALLRRFDRRIYVDLPNKDERARFLRRRLAKNTMFRVTDAAIDNIALRSTGMSLAQLDSVAEFALRNAVRSEKGYIDDADFEDAFETFGSGEVKEWDPDTLLRTARHEAGHTLLCWLSGDKPSYVTVVARGDHGGYMQHGDREKKALYTKEELLANIRVALGGRAAELVCYGPEAGLSTGPSGDLENATRTARALLCSYGMDNDFGMATVSPADDAASAAVRDGVNRILWAELKNAVRLIEENRAKFDRLVEALMEKDHLIGDAIDRILSF